MEQQLPIKRGNFMLLKVLGKGAYGEVYLARYENSNQFFAIKKVSRSQVEKNSKSKEYFTTETKLMSEFNHPNLMKVLSLMITANSYYIVTEYCNSGCLNSKLQEVESKDDFIPERTCFIYLFQIISGITEMHSRNIVHRDIKPDNILFHGDVVKIADFGFAKPIDVDYLVTKVGTPLYQAPEIMCTERNTVYTNAVDIWSIGVTFYKMLYKVHPWIAEDGSSRMTRFELKGAVQHQSGINLKFPSFPQVSSETKDLLTRMIEPNPTNRITLYQIITHPAFNFLQSTNQAHGEISLVLLQKAKTVLNDLKNRSPEFYKKLNFKLNDATELKNPLLDEEDFNLNDLSASLKIPAADPMKEFTERMEHERFYIRQLYIIVNRLINYIPTIIPATNTFWVGILWSLMFLAKKAESYSLHLYNSLQKKTNVFKIQGFDEKIKNSNGYEEELASLEAFVVNAKEELKKTLIVAQNTRASFSSLRNRESLLNMHNENIKFLSSVQTPEAAQEKLSDAVTMVCQVYFKTRNAINLASDPITMKWIAALDIFSLNEIEAQVVNGVNGFSREQFFNSIQNPKEVLQRIEEMAKTRYEKYLPK